MTRTSLLPSLTAVCALLLALSFGAFAQAPVARDASVEAAKIAGSTTAAAATSASRITESKSLAEDRNCIRDTGSLIRQHASDGKRACLPVAGRSYSRDDLQRTGATSTADALRMLDTSTR